MNDDFDEIKASEDEYIIIQKIRNLTANSFEILDKDYNFSDLLDPKILLPNAFKNEFSEFSDLSLEIQKFSFFEQKINKLRQLESQVLTTPIGEHMTVYLSYIPNADHLLPKFPETRLPIQFESFELNRQSCFGEGFIMENLVQRSRASKSIIVI